MSSTETAASARSVFEGALRAAEPELLAVRRDLHAHPELSWQETRTTAMIAARLEQAGVRVRRLPGTGLLAEIGGAGPVVALRADLDALPVDDLTRGEFASTVAGVSHSCGHDLHTAALLGAGLALTAVQEAGLLRGRVRLLFQPAEEVMPGGALELLRHGALENVVHVFGLHCDPSIDVGQVGLREGPLTAAADVLRIRVNGRGGHTSRPHLTEDLTFALGKILTELPAALSRRLDPRAGASLVWGSVLSGSAPNVIPRTGSLSGTVRMLDSSAWAVVSSLVTDLVHQIAAPYGVTCEVDYQRGVPPVVNEHGSTFMLGRAVERVLGEEGHVPALQSLGGEDFGWYLNEVPGAMGRLGTRTPGGPTYDLHQGNLVVDERAVAIGAGVLGQAALVALDH